MREYLSSRLILFLPTLILASLAIFLAMRVIPGDVASVILSEGGENQDLVSGLRSRIDRLREKALAFYGVHRGIRFGYDYVISARPVQ